MGSFEWLGIDLKLTNGDLTFGDDGDLAIHTNPVDSFVAALQHKAQIAANRVFDTGNPAISVRAGVFALQSDPRVKDVKHVKTRWDYESTDPDNKLQNFQRLVVVLDLTLANNEVLANFVLPLSYQGET